MIAALCVLPLAANAQEEKAERLDSATVSASRAGKQTPVTYTSLGKADLQDANPMNSLPMTLNLLPSVVTYNEGGTGLGNSAMTIRGSKGSQINVTLNGITLNDAESQEVFWVNIPSLTNFLSSVQVQRGLGTSANGAGAFGASINMSTAFVGAQPTGSVELSAGSYMTGIASGAVSTGLLPGGFYFNFAGNLGHTDGYIRNAKVNSQSLFAVLGWLSGKRSLRLTYLMGNQKSGITWDGIDLEQYAKDRRYNGAGEYYDEEGNVHYYPNQTDNYRQHHVQLNYTRAFGDRFTWSNTVNYTRGDGYDEYYKSNKKLKNYGFPADINPARSDIVYRKGMDNDYGVVNSNLRYRTRVLDVTGGLSWSIYRGGHWGQVLWTKTLGDVESPDWYSGTAIKRDASAFVRAEYHPLAWLTAYADLQYRSIRYSMTGVDDDWIEYGRAEEDRFNYNTTWRFFNPRGGITASWGAHKLYTSVAVGNREPGRGDIKENVKGTGLPIKPEKMVDFEAGYEFTGSRVVLHANLYAMEYWDMLLETGRLSSSGYAVKENVPRSWRRGVELSAAWQPLRWLKADGNVTLSMNQIADYTSYVPYDDYSGTVPINYGKTTMLMSPSTIGMGRLTFTPGKAWLFSVDGKYVGKQYLDNSMRKEMEIPSYFVMDAQLQKGFDIGPGHLTVAFYVHNLLNHMYYASGWRWESISPADGNLYSGVGVYPQPPINFMAKVRFTF
ncbi:MAG: TonB-dependent receptor [Bacteroidales bacterium]|nr:TonB-dependent receptor [Bacteroidales bacterium]